MARRLIGDFIWRFWLRFCNKYNPVDPPGVLFCRNRGRENVVCSAHESIVVRGEVYVYIFFVAVLWMICLRASSTLKIWYLYYYLKNVHALREALSFDFFCLKFGFRFAWAGVCSLFVLAAWSSRRGIRTVGLSLGSVFEVPNNNYSVVSYY